MELRQICELLKEERQRKGLSLEEASNKTKLPPTTIEKIEEFDNLKSLGKFYLKGFLKIYAVSLERNELVKPIEEILSDEKKWQELTGTEKEIVQKRIVSRPKIPKIQLGKKTILGFSSVLLLILIAILLPEKPYPAKVKQETAVKKPLPQKKAPQEIKTVSTPIKTAAKPLTSILTKEAVFVQVKADSKLIFQNVIVKGTKESWTGRKKLEIKISNPSLVTLEISGKIIPTANQRKPALYIITPEGFSVKK